jgi:hypothetical protein
MYIKAYYPELFNKSILIEKEIKFTNEVSKTSLEVYTVYLIIILLDSYIIIIILETALITQAWKLAIRNDNYVLNPSKAVNPFIECFLI